MNQRTNGQAFDLAGARVAHCVNGRELVQPMAWALTRLNARGFLDATPQRGGFTCLRTRLCLALKSSSREYDMYPTR